MRQIASKQRRLQVEKRRIGSLHVSVAGLGCNNFGKRLDADQSAAVVHAALDAGITFFDTADIYGDARSEEFLGRALGSNRDAVVLATKFGMATTGGSQSAHPDYVRRAAEESLRRLGTDRIDLYQLHIPDPDVPIADTLGALDELVREGKVREIGCSNFSSLQLQEAEEAADEGRSRFVSVQNEYSLLHRDPEAGVLDESVRARLAFLPYFPLASGLLTGKYRRGRPAPAGSRLEGGKGSGPFTQENMATVEKLIAFAGEHDHTLLELALSWLRQRPQVASIIAGATTPDQVRANAAATTAWQLDEAELSRVDELTSRPG